MTREEILNMQAGYEIDLLIQVNLFQNAEHCGLSYEEHSTPDGLDGWSGFVCPACGRSEDLCKTEKCVQLYSTRISKAWDVLEKLSLTDYVIEKVGDHYCVNFISESACAETAPLAICRAALLTTLED